METLDISAPVILSAFNYLGEEMLLAQFSILAENIQKALPPGHESSKSISDQIKRLQNKHEKWPEKILLFLVLKP